MLQKPEKFDHVILFLAIALTCFGVVMVYSASAVTSAVRYHDGLHFLKRQGGFALAGIALMLGAMCVDYHVWKKLAVFALVASVGLLAIVLIPGIGNHAGGSSRWINLSHGVRFQPSEFAKIALIMYMAHALDKKKDKTRSLGPGFLSYLMVLILLMLFLLKQPDLGSAVTLFLVAFTMLFVAGTRLSYIVSVVVLSIPTIYYLIASVGYRRRRFTAFLDPWQDPQNTGFQIIQSMLALGTGGVFGQGLGEGKQKLFYLPEAHTDFILAVIGEELGFVGVLVIMGMFAVLVQRSILVAMAAPDAFGRFLALGIAVLIGIEAVFNMGVVTGMLPTKGIALPFISYGGSSLLVTLFTVGILLNVSSRVKKHSP